ncbi:MAG: diaminopimelate decarboxylase [Candidatus Altiarchaeota archaeon]
MEDKLLLGLAKEHGTPLYVYDGDLIRDSFTSFRDAFTERYPNVRVCYAVKANSSLAILRLLARQGCGADVVSGGELSIALKAGVRAGDIVYTSNSKSPGELELALNQGVTVTHGNVDELKILAGIAGNAGKTARVAFRVNPDVSAATHPKIATGIRNTKFGLHLKDDLAFKAYEKASGMTEIQVVGLHCHIGSQITETESFEEAVSKMMDFAARLEDELHLRLEFIDVGGGLGISYHGKETLCLSEFADAIVNAFTKGAEKLSYEPTLVLEPGRYIVGPAGVLLAGVNSVKKTPYKNFINVDAGFNTLARPAMYDAYHRVRILGKKGGKEKYDIAGNVCESGDILARDRILPTPSRGDVITILDAGAYGFSMASEYNTCPLPAEVLVRNGNAELIRRRRTVEDVLNGQVIPDDLA